MAKLPTINFLGIDFDFSEYGTWFIVLAILFGFLVFVKVLVI
jgi:hypothetical protein